MSLKSPILWFHVRSINLEFIEQGITWGSHNLVDFVGLI